MRILQKFLILFCLQFAGPGSVSMVAAVELDTVTIAGPFRGQSGHKLAKLVWPKLPRDDKTMKWKGESYQYGQITDQWVTGPKANPELRLLFCLEPEDQSGAGGVIYSLGIFRLKNGLPILASSVATAAYTSPLDERFCRFDKVRYELLPGKSAIAVRTQRQHRTDRETLALFWLHQGKLLEVFSCETFSENRNIPEASPVSSVIIVQPRKVGMAGLQVVTTREAASPTAQGKKSVTHHKWRWDERVAQYAEFAAK